MLKHHCTNSILKMLFTLSLIIPSFLSAGDSIKTKPTLSYREVRRYQEMKMPRIELHLIGEGFDPNTIVMVKQKLLNGTEHEVNAFLTILENGVVANDGKPQIFTLNSFSVGEPIGYMLCSLDGKQTAQMYVIPFPIEKKDDAGRKISVMLLDPEAKFFKLEIQGFEPSEKLTVNSQSENEKVTFDVQVSAKGGLETMLAPEVIGIKNGLGSIEVIGKNTTLKLAYPWGKRVRAGSEEDKFSNQ